MQPVSDGLQQHEEAQTSRPLSRKSSGTSEPTEARVGDVRGRLGCRSPPLQHLRRRLPDEDGVPRPRQENDDHAIEKVVVGVGQSVLVLNFPSKISNQTFSLELMIDSISRNHFNLV